MDAPLLNRQDAGQKLAQKLLNEQKYPPNIVLGLPRGGIPVASEIAQKLQLPLNLCLAKKLGSPKNPEVAIGAIADNNVIIADKNFLQQRQISEQFLSDTIEAQRKKLIQYELLSQQAHDLLAQNRFSFNDRLKDSTVILVDDGIATGLTLQAGIATLQHYQVKNIIVAVPVIARDLLPIIQSQVTQLVYLIAPKKLNSVSFWYRDFAQVTNEEVFELLQKTNNDYAANNPLSYQL